MTFTPHFLPQRSPEWYALRVGVLTGSCMPAVTAVRRRGTGELKDRIDLRRRLVTERVIGQPVEEPFITKHLQRGMDLEAEAFTAYEIATGLLARQVGFCAHNDLVTGCSPDGYIGDFEGVLELKCPKSTTHLEYLQAGVLPEAYVAQCQHAIWITGAEWCDFCSFDDRFPEDLELFRVRYWRKDFDVAAYELIVRTFLSEVERDLEQLRTRAAGGAERGEEENRDRPTDRNDRGGDSDPAADDRAPQTTAGGVAEA